MLRSGSSERETPSLPKSLTGTLPLEHFTSKNSHCIAYQEVYKFSSTVALKALSVASLIPQRKAQPDKLNADSDVAPITAWQASVARFLPVFISRKYPNSVGYADFMFTLLLP